MRDAGGAERVRSFEDQPRNRNQISNLRRNNPQDEVAEILDLCKEQQQHKETAFVQDVAVAVEKTVFLANEQQLKDIERFCTNSSAFCILGVDPTYNIGKFYVTVSTYRHLMLLTKKGVHPVMIGPVLIHYRKGFDSYFQLPSNIVRFNKEAAKVVCFCTDGEANVSDALKAVFTDGIHLMSDIHMHDNIAKKFTELGINKEVKKEILDDIFGRADGDCKIKGLVDSWSSDEVTYRTN